MSFKTKTIEAQTIFGLSVDLSLSQKMNYEIIRSHWQKFNAELRNNKIQLNSHWEKFAVTLKADLNYSYFIGITDSRAEKIFTQQLCIPQNTYAVFTHKGNMVEIKSTLFSIYKEQIPSSKIELNANRNLVHFEKYDHRFKWNNPNSKIDIFVPIH